MRANRNPAASLFRWLFYASLGFAAVALYRSGDLQVDLQRVVPAIALALPLLLLGFVADSVAWWAMLRRSDCAVGLTECVAATGLSIFAKYIPGKIWAMVGRATYIASRSHLSIGRLSVIAVNAQVLMLWIGLVLGMVGLVALGGWPSVSALSASALLALTLVTFTDWAHRLAARCLCALLRREVYLPRLSLGKTLPVLGGYALTWLCWSAGFQVLLVAISSRPVPWSAALAFPLATVAGIIALIAPGGLGVREGVLVGVMLLVGLSGAEASSVALGSRLWFICGEAIFFVIGGWAQRRLAAASA